MSVTHKDYIVEDRKDGKGFGVYALKHYVSGELIAVLDGDIIAEPHLHSLMIRPGKHLYDPGFTGSLLHSCNPNSVILPDKLEIWATRAIDAGEAITVDYATTEDRLVKQFPCSCGEDICRHWIKGRKEETNESGLAYLRSIP